MRMIGMLNSSRCYLRALRHRNAMLQWVRDLVVELEPLRREFAGSMPEPAATVANHIHIPLFYTLLRCVDYPNPDLAFRFFTQPVEL